MEIAFIQPEPSSDEDETIEVHLGKILHGFIQKTRRGNYCYYRVIANKAVPRHEADDLDELKRMVVETA